MLHGSIPSGPYNGFGVDIQQQLRELLTDEWQSTSVLSERTGAPLLVLVPLLRAMWAAGEAESSHGQWRKAQVAEGSSDRAPDDVPGDLQAPR